MIHHIAIYHLSEDVELTKIEWMVRETRIHLLKMPCVRAMRCGHAPDLSCDWTFFFSVDVDSVEKHAAFLADPALAAFLGRVLEPNTTACFATFFETDPGDSPLLW